MLWWEQQLTSEKKNLYRKTEKYKINREWIRHNHPDKIGDKVSGKRAEDLKEFVAVWTDILLNITETENTDMLFYMLTANKFLVGYDLGNLDWLSGTKNRVELMITTLAKIQKRNQKN